jgi:hypothetical protein
MTQPRIRQPAGGPVWLPDYTRDTERAISENGIGNLVAGSNITLTEGAGGAVTIASSGSGGGGSGTFMIDDGTAAADGTFTFDDGGA